MVEGRKATGPYINTRASARPPLPLLSSLDRGPDDGDDDRRAASQSAADPLDQIGGVEGEQDEGEEEIGGGRSEG